VGEASLPLVYIAGGGLTLVGAPVIGRLSDRFGKLRVYRIVAPISAILMLVVTNLPRVSLALAVAAVAGLMVTNAGRMVAAMAMVTGSVEPRLRGGFMSANSSVQHLATGLGAFVGGRIITQGPGGTLRHFDLVGLIAVAATLLSLWLAGRLRPAGPERETSMGFSLGAADEAFGDAGDPLPAVESA
jgi:predicted MFS family arabinose efflux permease